MDIKSLTTLIAIVDHGSFAAAGQSLGLSASAVSLQIGALEGELGRPLFDRSTRPPSLTENGRLFVERARALVQDWQILTENFQTDTAGGMLRLGAVHTVVSGMLPVALRRLRSRHEGLLVRLHTGLSHELEDRIRRGSLDCALVTDPPDRPSDLIFHDVAEEPLVVLAPASAPGRSDAAILSQNPYVRFSPAARMAKLIDRALSDRAVQINTVMEVDTLEGVISLVSQGLGVSIVPLQDDRPLPDTVRHVPFGAPAVTRKLCLVELQGNPKRRLVKVLADELRAVAG
jgi:DNA-binding transcriptional LysR family regulator